MNKEKTEIEINLVEEIKFLFRNKMQLISIALIISLLVGLYSYTLPREYSSTVIFMPSESNVQMGSSSSMGGLVGLVGLGSASGPTQTSIALSVINSRSFLNFFSEKNNITQILFIDDWDSNQKKWKNRPPNPKIIASKIRDMFTIKRSQSDIFELEFEWTESKQTALWANALISDLDDHMRDQKIQSGELKIKFLNSQLEKNTLNDINNIFFKMIEDQIKNNMLANVSDGYVFKVLDDAIEPTSNHKPKRLQIIFLGFFLGLLIGILYLYSLKRLKI